MNPFLSCLRCFWLKILSLALSRFPKFVIIYAIFKISQITDDLK